MKPQSAAAMARMLVSAICTPRECKRDQVLELRVPDHVAWKMAEHPIRHWLTRMGSWTAAPAAFLMVPIYGALWLIFERDTFNWHAGAVLATWFMTLVIQRAEYRDTQAVHAKLDELLHVQGKARNALTNIDRKDPEDIEKHRKIERAND